MYIFNIILLVLMTACSHQGKKSYLHIKDNLRAPQSESTILNSAEAIAWISNPSISSQMLSSTELTSNWIGYSQAFPIFMKETALKEGSLNAQIYSVAFRSFVNESGGISYPTKAGRKLVYKRGADKDERYIFEVLTLIKGEVDKSKKDYLYSLGEKVSEKLVANFDLSVHKDLLEKRQNRSKYELRKVMDSGHRNLSVGKLVFNEETYTALALRLSVTSLESAEKIKSFLSAAITSIEEGL